MSDATTLRRERMPAVLTWHYAGLALLAVLVLFLAIRFGLDWSASGSSGAIAEKHLELRSLELQTAPLRGLDHRVDDSRKQIQQFLDQRIPQNYSAIATQVGELSVKAGVRLTRVQYSQGKSSAGLTEISMDASISGEYPAVMRFINSLERDKTFFVIRAMALTGQQAGMVNLRLRVSTWLRPSDVPSGLPSTSSQPPVASAAPAHEGV